ncbi:MAG: polyprenol monophosphomannose synthase [Planctomycetes bacterium]|nr:polyprenol monophosphomannose synthase [Planctomycetota bacterium]
MRGEQGETAVLLPTYNERETVVEVLERLLRAAEQLPGRTALLVLDDASPDGTADAVEAAFGRVLRSPAGGEPTVRVVRRPKKEGLGAALLHGFRLALGERFERIATLDADLSHEPEALPRLVEACGEHDLVIGSRYARGGAAPGLTLPRRLLSKAANLAWRLAAGRDVRDLTSGFRCYRSGPLAAVLRSAPSSASYAFLAEVAVRFARLGFRIREVPITFRARGGGASKLTAGVLLDSARTWTRCWRRAEPVTHAAAQGG